MPICGALWFLTALFFVNIFYFSIDKIKNKHLKYIVIILLSLAGCIIPRYFRLPLGIDISLMGVGLFQIGTILKKNVEVFKIETNIYTVFLCVLLGSVICFYNSSINIRNGVYGNIILYYICASLMTIGWYAFFRLFFRWNTLRRIMTYIGKNSIVYLCLNQLLLLPFNKICLLVSHNYILVIVKIIILFLTLVILQIGRAHV